MNANAILSPTRRSPLARRALLSAVLALAGVSQVVRANSDLLSGAMVDSRQSSQLFPLELRSRLSDVPYDQATLRRLAAHERAQGQTGEARKLTNLAGQLGWRDSGTQLMLIEDAAARRDAGQAIRHIDAILRRKPDLASVLMPVLHAGAADDLGRQTLLAQLDAHPPWREEFFNHVDLIPAQYRGAHERLLRQLSARRSLVPNTELVPYLVWLADNGETRRARTFWIALTNTKDGFVLDPEFDGLDPAKPGQSIANPFEWTAYHVPGIDLRAIAETDHLSSRSLLVDTDGSAFGNVLAQRLVLPAGRFRVIVTTPSPDLFTKGALRWSLQCLPDGSVVTSDNRPISSGWQQSFDVPAANCESQKLSLDARRVDAPAFGAIRIEKVSIEPVALAVRQGA